MKKRCLAFWSFWEDREHFPLVFHLFYHEHRAQGPYIQPVPGLATFGLQNVIWAKPNEAVFGTHKQRFRLCWQDEIREFLECFAYCCESLSKKRHRMNSGAAQLQMHLLPKVLQYQAAGSRHGKVLQNCALQKRNVNSTVTCHPDLQRWPALLSIQRHKSSDLL